MTIRAAFVLLVCTACGQDLVVQPSDDATVPDAGESTFWPLDASAPDVGPSPPAHDAAAPEPETYVQACVDAGADASALDDCPPPPGSYCTDGYAVRYERAPCGDAGSCTFAPVVDDCTLFPCHDCVVDDAGLAGCVCWPAGP